jgi:Mg2+ and Co2+ transporter CorA
MSVPGGTRAMLYYLTMIVLLLAAIGLYFFVKNKQ